ncbi:hypothetical protein [Myxococcus eversor]|uniref:hypothetical protein n=1 Tax=Myxococcus eversor TaxID=2709661 RepID=UPI0013D0FEAD|nr:hypothetical protein [Myxococcus eversor]
MTHRKLDSPRVHLQAVLAVIGAVQSSQRGPSDDVSALIEHAEQFMDGHPDVDWANRKRAAPSREALVRALALVPRALLRDLQPTSLILLGVAGEA